MTLTEPTTAPLTASDHEQRIPMSYEAFLEQVDERAHAEWVNGEALIFMPPVTIHQRIADFLAHILISYVELFNLGVVITAPFEMRVFPAGNAREPDILFVATENLHRLDDKRLNGPADLVVEVVSPESARRDRADKFAEYQQAGIREYWLIDPRPGMQRVDGWHLVAGSYQPLVADEAGRFHSRVLDGFWFKAAWLWQEPLPGPVQALMQLPAAAEALRRSLETGEEYQ